MPVFKPRHLTIAAMPAPAVSTKRRSVVKPLVATFVMALVAFTLFKGYAGSHSVAQAIAQSSPVAQVAKMVDSTPSAAQKAAADKESRMQTYTKTVNDLIAAHPGENIAVSTIDLSDGNSLTVGDQGTFTAASTAKLITAITLLHQADLGQTSLAKKVDGQTIGTLLKNMIVNSDNDAWNSLNYHYLSHATLKSYMTSQGYSEYDPDANTLLPVNMAQLIKKLYEGELLGKENTDLLLSYMQQANKREYIVAGIPSGYTVYHKAGWLDGLMHDVAIISNGQNTIVLAIYTYNGTSDGDVAANQDLFKQITSAALQAYFTD
jgi:beta-lactamase class A